MSTYRMLHRRTLANPDAESDEWTTVQPPTAKRFGTSTAGVLHAIATLGEHHDMSDEFDITAAANDDSYGSGDSALASEIEHDVALWWDN